MELILQQGLPHQQKAIDSICSVFKNVVFDRPEQFYTNPIIPINSSTIQHNICEIQKELAPEYRSFHKDAYLNLDIKMETGTGKTYVYSKAIFELHKLYGLNKFIIVVPSLPIKAGTSQFLMDDYTRRHFADACGYDCEIELGVLEAPKGQKKGRTYFPSEVSDFVKGSCQNSKKIYVLVLNMQLLTNGKVLTRDDYDYGVEGFYRPLDALKATRPLVIIDEPHRFDQEQKALKTIINNISPQCIIRFGATFPTKEEGRGKNKTKVTDYRNLLYNLDACASFNQGLIKGVSKEHFEAPSKREEKVKIASINNKESVNLIHKKKDGSSKSYTLKIGDSLSIISNAFEGVVITAIDKKSVGFSNGITKYEGNELDVDIYMTSYQEQMIKLALRRHFETERENFCNRTFKIKTLALFFIDDISSYRVHSDGKKPYLLEAFERFLREEIESTLKVLSPEDVEYKNYLEASLCDIQHCHAGYFSEDNANTDEEIAKQVKIILHEKKELLSFRRNDGSYNTTRFLFSKWTLKEGWDNPNVFTIAKLRSSGSDTTKLQEVGRGLRLPVDENGNRISNEDFSLNYIVDFTEADFAQELVNQINGDKPQSTTISEEQLTSVASKLHITTDELFDILYLEKRYIDRNKNIKPETRNLFFEEYPEFSSGLTTGKIKDRNKQESRSVKIRPAVYNELKSLWEAINHKYFLFYDEDLNIDLENVVFSIFEKPGVFSDIAMNSSIDTVRSNGSEMMVVKESGVSYLVQQIMPYGLFLKRISSFVNIPVKVIHSALCRFAKKYGREFEKHLNENSALSFCREFIEWRNINLQGRFKYVRGKTPLGATALTYANGKVRNEITQGRIGTKIIEGIPSEKYLYDTMAYDSPLEKSNIMSDIEEVIVYGKIPRSSIAIPVITGGTYSPDFMYVVKKKNGNKELNIVVETKDVEGKDSLRDTEKIKIECAEIFFNTLKIDGYSVSFRTQLGNKQMVQVINEVLGPLN